MRSLLLPLAAVTLLAGCSQKTVTSAGVAGSFVRQDALVPGLITRLHVTPTGLTVTTPTAAVTTSGSVEINGKPVVNGAVQTELGFAAHGAVLFASTRCGDDHACAFTTAGKCEGTLTADDKGNVILVATGDCAPWSGKWIAEKEGDAKAQVCPPAPVCAPCSSASPPEMPPGRRLPTKMGCMNECAQEQMGCARECKVGDAECLHRCGDATSLCAQRCP
jgi:hypothetical protein